MCGKDESIDLPKGSLWHAEIFLLLVKNWNKGGTPARVRFKTWFGFFSFYSITQSQFLSPTDRWQNRSGSPVMCAWSCWVTLLLHRITVSVSVRQMAAQKRRPGRVCVVVLGDVARSPRMCYHAESLAARGHAVDVVGYVRQDAVKLNVSKVASLYSLWPMPGWISGGFA